MNHLTEQQVTAMAPNANAVANAKKIIKSNGFTSLSRSADDTFYMGECKGSGSSVYSVSVDFIDEASPVCRCSCPSRQFPCKHGLALMLKILEDGPWDACEIPQTILDKRARKEAREEKKEEKAKSGGKDGKPAKAPTASSLAARKKKLKKQLEGLDIAEKVVSELLNAGLATLRGTSLKTYQDLAKQLGDYYLPGPERIIRSLILQMQDLEKNGGKENFGEAARTLVRLRALIKKSRAYLSEKLEKGNVDDDDSVLYEELGGIWTLERLNELGLKKENARLLQLSFQESCDMARKELVEQGWWIDIDSGEISVTSHYRPLKALKYVKEEDSVSDVVTVPCLSYYPGGGNRRIRWEGQAFEPVTTADLTAVQSHASGTVAEAVKAAKNELKNTLSSGRYGCLLSYSLLGRTGEEAPYRYALKDHTGMTIRLLDRPGDPPCVFRLTQLPDPELLENNVLFGILWYSAELHAICLHPYAVITKQAVVHLLY